MKNYLRYAFIAVLAFICNVSFAQTVVTFTAETDKGSFDATQTGTEEQVLTKLQKPE